MTPIRPSDEVRREEGRRYLAVQRFAAGAAAIVLVWAIWSTVQAFAHHGALLGLGWMLVAAPAAVGFAYVGAAACSMSLVIPRPIRAHAPASRQDR